MTINILDVAIILILIMFAIVGFKRGAIKELVSLVGIIAVFNSTDKFLSSLCFLKKS